MGNTVYIEYNFTVQPPQPASEILISELGAVGFESFVEEADGVLAYIQQADWRDDMLESVGILSNPNFKIAFVRKEIAQENWNEVWEQNFHPIMVDDVCMIRAPFHEKQDVSYDIVIEPKMSFGTGHHETTHMMLQHILELEMEGKAVLDMGCGTGVLAILAAMRGASPVDAVDIDNWCYLNAKENVARNNVDFIQVQEGDASLLKDRRYHVIIANINRNILLGDIGTYVSCLSPDGILLLSGFYIEDLEVITQKCREEGLRLEKNIEKNNWVAAKYVF